MKGVIGLLDCHNSPGLGLLTSDRDLASTSFLGRYAFMDFALSNFCNSEINKVGILVRNHQRSILKHMGNMLSWLENTKIGRINICYNEQGQLNPAYNSDINNIRQNDWMLYDSNATHLIFCSPSVVMNIDFRPLLEEHIRRGEKITAIYQKIDNGDEAFLSSQVFDIDENGYVTSVRKNDGRKKEVNASLECWIINRTTLANLTHLHSQVDISFNMKDMLVYALTNKLFKIHTAEHKGYARCFDSMKHYMQYSFELLDVNVIKQLFHEDWPIYTLTHDTPPALYGAHSQIKNSFISNGCVIDGSVTDSIICRNVKIGKGSKIKRSIILSNVAIGQNVTLSDVIIDKYSVVTSRHAIEGDNENPIYLRQGAIL